jgi:hypothetical protein
LFGFPALVVAIWLHNRDILRDLYDYSSVIVAAGKIEAGLRPYVDFRSTMQSATYALNRGVELLFGANYLALTYGGLIVALGGGAALAWLWRRSFGWTAGAVLAGAVAVSGLAQHVVVFYNPIGLVCLAIVAAALAHDPRLWRLRSPETALACLALVLGGTNKINFHAFTCGLAALLVIRAWWMDESSGRSTLASIGMLILCGALLPLGLELLWTGASLRQWIDNVLLLPSERVGLVTEFLRRDIILHPAYDIYHHLLFKKLALVGLLFLAASGFATWHGLAGDLLRRRAGLWLVVAVPVCALGGLLLTVTNVETPALTTLPFVVGAAAVWAAFERRMPAPARRFGTIALPAAAAVWIVVGGYAAWEGSRVMFGAVDPNRASFIRLVSPPPSLVYLRGVRLDAGLHHSLIRAAAEAERLKAQRGNLSRVLFGPAMEWFERAYPESILRGMPVWYHLGTAFRNNDGPWLEASLASKRIDTIILNPSWESWPGPFRDYLDRYFTHSAPAQGLQIYEARTAGSSMAPPRSVAALRPLMFCRRTHSNIHISSTQIPPELDFCDSPAGEFLGTAGSSRWRWTNDVRDLSGTFVAVLQPGEGAPVRIAWRIVDDSDSRVLASGDSLLSAEAPCARTTFSLQLQTKGLRFEIDSPANSTVRAGWRDLWVRQIGTAQTRPPPAAVDGYADDFAEINTVPFVRHASIKDTPPEGGWIPSPLEAWRDCGTTCSPWKVRIAARRRHDVSGSPTLLSLVWYKGGRIEILREKMISPEVEETVELEGWMPEPGGWMGVFARAADIAQPPNCFVRIESWTP